jgi:hypothetical protein
VAAVPPPPAPAAPVEPPKAADPELRDPRALAHRAIERELRGDRAGAIADVRAAIALETDPAHRASLEDFLRRLQ